MSTLSTLEAAGEWGRQWEAVTKHDIKLERLQGNELYNLVTCSPHKRDSGKGDSQLGIASKYGGLYVISLLLLWAVSYCLLLREVLVFASLYGRVLKHSFWANAACSPNFNLFLLYAGAAGKSDARMEESRWKAHPDWNCTLVYHDLIQVPILKSIS